MMMTVMRRRLGCCSRDTGMSVDLDEQERIMRYEGLENCILNTQAYADESDGDGDDEPEAKEKAGQLADADAMKETFANLLLGGDVTGGSKGQTCALALSNAITTLAATVFGELWKLEPLPRDRKHRWHAEMDWFLSPTNYMVQLVPTKRSAANGRMLEIMTPKARADIHLNLPALRKLDSMLLETLDSMVCNEFWYTEEGRRRAEGSKRWWLPTPQVPEGGLSASARKKLMNHKRLLLQVFKAARSINQNVLLEMPVPTVIRDSLPKPGKASLGEDLYKVLTAESSQILNSFNIESQHDALEVINRLEAASFSWRARIQQAGESSLLVHRADGIVQHLKTRFPNLPPSFLDVTKVQYGKDIGHSILEAYSRLLGNLALTILTRIGDVMREDTNAAASHPSGVPSSTSSCFMETTWRSDSTSSSTYSASTSACEFDINSYCTMSTTSDTKSSPAVTPNTRRQVCCTSGEACLTTPPPRSS